MEFDKNLPTRSIVVDDFTDLNSHLVHMVLNRPIRSIIKANILKGYN